MLLLLNLIARPVASLFNDNPAVIDTIVLYLRLVPIGYGLQGVLMLSNTALNVLNRPLQATALMITRIFVLYVPLAIAASTVFGLSGIFGAAAIANLIVGIMAYLWLRRVLGVQSEPQVR